MNVYKVSFGDDRDTFLYTTSVDGIGSLETHYGKINVEVVEAAVLKTSDWLPQDTLVKAAMSGYAVVSMTDNTAIVVKSDIPCASFLSDATGLFHIEPVGNRTWELIKRYAEKGITGELVPCTFEEIYLVTQAEPWELENLDTGFGLVVKAENAKDRVKIFALIPDIITPEEFIVALENEIQELAEFDAFETHVYSNFPEIEDSEEFTIQTYVSVWI